jgi:penicillin-binding protein 1A
MDREVQTVVEDYYRTLRGLPVNERGETAQSALIVIDPHTGDVLGVAGAAGEKSANRLQNFATETLRSPGSAIKPISVYAPALARGIIHWGSVYDDVPVRFEGESLRAWPKNADGTYRGLCTVAYAVAHSTNTVAVRILEELGLEESFRFAKEKFHLSSLRRDRTVNDCDVAPLALGQLGYGVTLRELTDAYTVFADRGVYHPWRSYYRVTDAEGRVLLSRADASETVLSEANAAIMTKLLEGVVKEGTSSSITLRRLVECAGKTGTTGEDHDRWFVGYTPDLICGVWCGYEYPAPLAGRNLCTGIWNDVMSRLWDRLGGRTSFSVPASVYRASYCRDSGELLSDACTHDPRGERSAVGWFAEGNAPHAVCDRHVLCDYDVIEGGISHGYCPAESVERVALLRVERQFPIPVRVADAQYVLRGDPMRTPPNENANAAYDAAEDRAHHGTSGSSPPYHRSCPVHRAKERTWWQELPPLLPDSEE